MKKLSRSIIMGMALSLMVLVGLTGSAGAAKAVPTFTVGSVAYTYESTQITLGTYEDKLEAFDLEWTGYRPDTACIGVLKMGASDPFVSTCESIKGNQQKHPQNFNMSGMIPGLTGGTSYNLRVELLRHGDVIDYRSCSVDVGTTARSSSSCDPQ